MNKKPTLEDIIKVVSTVVTLIWTIISWFKNDEK